MKKKILLENRWINIKNDLVGYVINGKNKIACNLK